MNAKAKIEEMMITGTKERASEKGRSIENVEKKEKEDMRRQTNNKPLRSQRYWQACAVGVRCSDCHCGCCCCAGPSDANNGSGLGSGTAERAGEHYVDTKMNRESYWRLRGNEERIEDSD